MLFPHRTHLSSAVSIPAWSRYYNVHATIFSPLPVYSSFPSPFHCILSFNPSILSASSRTSPLHYVLIVLGSKLSSILMMWQSHLSLFLSIISWIGTSDFSVMISILIIPLLPSLTSFNTNLISQCLYPSQPYLCFLKE